MIITALLLFAGIALGQTLKKGCVIGVHHINNIVLAEGVTMDDLINYYTTKMFPAFEKAIPGIKVFMLKGNRGEEENNFGMIYYMESVKVRDEYWPEKDVTSEKANTVLQEYVVPLQEGLQKLVKSSESGHTDCIVL